MIGVMSMPRSLARYAGRGAGVRAVRADVVNGMVTKPPPNLPRGVPAGEECVMCGILDAFLVFRCKQFQSANSVAS